MKLQRMFMVAGPGLLVVASMLPAQDLPAIRTEGAARQFILQGKPFLMLGGELGNSSSLTAKQADEILPKLARLHFNTLLIPVAWDQIEPHEGHFDFSILDHWIDVARTQDQHLVLLWFGSWKNALSEYAPAWVLSDTKRFPREISAEGLPLEILTPLDQETARADSRAFAALMRHVREKDASQQTVVMVQVENEIGFLGIGGRDRSAAANRLFEAAAPPEVASYLDGHRAQLPEELAEQFNPAAHTWKAMFGHLADEAFMAWEYGLFANQVVRAGKAEYALPMYMNAQLPAPFERGGEYPSGGPYPLVQAIYRAAAPAVDFYAPDIYWPDFAAWVDRYRAAGNPAFVPEARLDEAPGNALYLYGAARGFGFSPFAVDSLPDDASKSAGTPGIADLYAVLSGLSDTIVQAQEKDQTRGLVLHATSPRPSQTVSLDGFLFRATLSRTWPARQLATQDGAMMVLSSAPNEFLVVGSGLTITFARDPDVDDQVAGIADVEQVAYAGGQWVTERVLNGDQTDQGRALQLDPHAIRVYRVKLFTYPGH
jgi:beta-galactosidase GanA